MQTASTASEWLKLLDQKDVFLVRTSKQLREVVSGNSDLSPFNDSTRKVLNRIRNLPSPTRETIVQNLEFNDRGLVHGDYAELAKHVSKEELFDFFSIFGINKVLATDYQNNYCESQGTCAKKIDKICTSNCHH